jgi:hypothetical protein
MVRAVTGSEVAEFTVNVAVPVATLLSALVAMAVMVADPFPAAVTTPAALTVAIEVVLEVQAT